MRIECTTIRFKFARANGTIFVYHNAVMATWGGACFHIDGITGELREYIESNYRSQIDAAQDAMRA